jgi:hypothetical protein
MVVYKLINQKKSNFILLIQLLKNSLIVILKNKFIIIVNISFEKYFFYLIMFSLF